MINISFDPSEDMIIVKIKDTGSGIQKNDLKLIFELFGKL